MTDKPNETPESNEPPAKPVKETTEHAATSPFDNPTGEFPPVRPATGKDVPRTDDDLGLDPDVPPAGAAAAPDSRTGESEAPTYAFATIPPSTTAPTESLRRRRESRRGTQDLGLLILRLILGVTFLYHGTQKLAGWFHGPGLDGTRQMLEQGGWKHIELSTAMLTVAEVGGGALLVLGLATPLAAGAVLAAIADALLWKEGMAPGFQYKVIELEAILAGLAAVVILVGPGRLSFDRNRGWSSRPAWGSFLVLILALAAAVGGWLVLHGGNPFVGIFD
ncbi:DoxX family membrane protein [Nocardia mexicana]|uniref:Putative oxidoreductase n=1 Tax=Nocardia mexicana TaxID=279262 RepID=A0A370H109_9NOCA|nr:DoxX family membrane protein [Nocardia mexicana]RDI49193.1 putative oxidoreductase [Nocardia mexicana]